MKPCSHNRKLIAWLALGELDARREAGLRSHIRSCATCRCYLQEISRFNEALATAQQTPDIEPSEAFHRRLVARLRTEQRGSWWSLLATRLVAGPLNWRVALPLTGAAVIVFAVLILLPRQPGAPCPVAAAVISTGWDDLLMCIARGRRAPENPPILSFSCCISLYNARGYYVKKNVL